jgi:hypothetical protein
LTGNKGTSLKTKQEKKVVLVPVKSEKFETERAKVVPEKSVNKSETAKVVPAKRSISDSHRKPIKIAIPVIIRILKTTKQQNRRRNTWSMNVGFSSLIFVRPGTREIEGAKILIGGEESTMVEISLSPQKEEMGG